MYIDIYMYICNICRLLQMCETTSLIRVEGKGADLSDFGNGWFVRLKARGTPHKHCTLVDKIASNFGIGIHFCYCYTCILELIVT